MAQRTVRMLFTTALFMVAASAACGETAYLTVFTEQAVSLKLDVPNHTATIEAAGTLERQPGWNCFYLNETARVQTFTINDRKVGYRIVPLADTARVPGEFGIELPVSDVSGEPEIVLFESGDSGKAAFDIRYEASFFEQVDDVRFSNENVGREISGTILDRGAYLSPSAYYYPVGSEKLASYRITADIPSSWEAISDGNNMSTAGSASLEKGRKVQSYANPFPSDGMMFMAAPYAVRTDTTKGVAIACYFFPEDTALAPEYLAATRGYVEMYDSLIGPYPYSRFTVAENFFPTGYGMPAWTLLGQQVLRLPFIKYTSLGHEVLHNWWGNSVYVDYERGNWCEAATVYGADYRYKLKQSPEAAESYRKNILKQYNSYVNEGNDFPIRQFTSRTSPNTRTIGYNKAMMVYHMIEQEIGTKPFFAAWRYIYDQYRMKKISWEEWISAFEKTSHVDLSWVIPQWIDRTGATQLALKEVRAGDSGPDGYRQIAFTLEEPGDQVYRLRVPIRFGGASDVLDTFVMVNEPQTSFQLRVPESVDHMIVDPDYHLFRRLYPEEIEPIVSAVLGASGFVFVTSDSSKVMREQFRSFAQNMTGNDSVAILARLSQPPTDGPGAPVLLNPVSVPDYIAGVVTIADDHISIGGTDYPRGGHTFVLAGQNLDGYGKYLVVIAEDGESLSRIGQLIPHYGKYSYLVFKGAHNVGKGQWPVTASPLQAEF